MKPENMYFTKREFVDTFVNGEYKTCFLPQLSISLKTFFRVHTKAFKFQIWHFDNYQSRKCLFLDLKKSIMGLKTEMGTSCTKA